MSTFEFTSTKTKTVIIGSVRIKADSDNSEVMVAVYNDRRSLIASGTSVADVVEKLANSVPAQARPTAARILHREIAGMARMAFARVSA